MSKKNVQEAVDKKQEDTKKMEAKVQCAFLNMLWEQGVLSEEVHTVAMRKVAKGA